MGIFKGAVDGHKLGGMEHQQLLAIAGRVLIKICPAD
jgi:hypothetical protein